MAAIFLFGTLLHAPLLRAVAGEDVPSVEAALPDAAVAGVAGAPYPVLVLRDGARARGQLIEVSGEALARLDFYEACFGYLRSPVEVVVAGVVRAAEVWRPGPGMTAATPEGDWSLDAWVRDWGALAVIAAGEVIRQRAGGATAAEVGARYWMIAARAQAEVSAGAWRRPARVGKNPARDAVEVVERHHPYSGFHTVEDLVLRHRQFDGALSEPQRRSVFRAADAVTVLPYDPFRDRILVIEQLRMGPFVHGDAHPWLLEPVAGMIDAGETPEAAARRETVEEAGLELGALHPVARYYPSPGGLAQVLISYVGIADLPDGVAGTGGHVSEGEDILSHLVDWETARAMLEGGDMANAPLILSMQWLMLHRSRLQEEA
ncbi:NUDIX domain-containing protein [Roseicyclus marinus]|uniref:NUDIX domain-containing protein n=1 Tax=Roseicyclus marinus TaxID=2161673 RepID=UPI00240F1A0E|nr:gamma-glutamylcyclotransferase [Roseicyclus marinus]MDG3040021.1 NUDIX domain-containing protein [Roseicyclus marinus]